ncbi:ribosomal protein L7/L12 [Fulvivirgaceae bacterium BMA12]|uniref:Ribosomal protein L7/L12 n=1 Tax=Agaribacillus aureus TaxID=3051825 RepID=A0ABT8L6I5_9BACT|nr:ribosomal protein L7/L12 [Fulvivirgaceae bacterium BMA12]
MNVSDEQKQHVRGLLVEGRKIEAIKYIRQHFGLGLKDSKRLIDLIDKDIREDEYQYDRGKVIRHSMKRGGQLVGIIFAGVGSILLGVALFIFFGNQRLINEGVVIEATVISTPSSPLFEYEVNGEIYKYQSDVTTNPPSYEIGEVVSMYVNPNDPYDLLIDSFPDRWLAITILGAMGALFFGIGMLVAVVFRPR